MTPFAIVGTVYLILLAICFAVSAASLAVIAWKMELRHTEPTDWRAMRDADYESLLKSTARLFAKETIRTNGHGIEHGEG